MENKGGTLIVFISNFYLLEENQKEKKRDRRVSLIVHLGREKMHKRNEEMTMNYAKRSEINN